MGKHVFHQIISEAKKPLHEHNIFFSELHMSELSIHLYAFINLLLPNEISFHWGCSSGIFYNLVCACILLAFYTRGVPALLNWIKSIKLTPTAARKQHARTPPWKIPLQLTFPSYTHPYSTTKINSCRYQDKRMQIVLVRRDQMFAMAIEHFRELIFMLKLGD